MNNIVSIIVPCYNQAVYLDDALSSVLAQNYPYWECIVVNDGSPDNTAEVAGEWCKRDSRFIYIEKQNGGLSSARNAGLQAAKGTYVLPLDADDKIDSSYLQKAVTILDASPAVSLVYGDAMYFGAKNGAVQLEAYSFKKLLEQNVIYCSAICRLEEIKKAGNYDEALIYGLEDWELWIRLLKNGSGVEKIPATVFWYRFKEQSMITSINAAEDKRKAMYDYIYSKHIDLYLSHLGNPILQYRQLRSAEYALAAFKKTPTYRMIKRLNFFRK